MKCKVADQLSSLLVPITELVLDPENAREHSASSVKSIADSYAEHGQRKPLVVHKDSKVVLAGNGQLMAAKQLGWTHVAAIHVDDTEEQARRYALRDNRTAELSRWDVESLHTTLKGLHESDVGADGLGWSELELDALVNLSGAYEPPPFSDGAYEPPKSKHSVETHTVAFSAAQWVRLSVGLGGEEPTAESITDAVAPPVGTDD